MIVQLLLIFYVGILFLKFQKRHRQPLQLWGMLALDRAPLLGASDVPCTGDADCRTDHKCHRGKCVRLARNARDCDPATGRWIAVSTDGETRLKCSCKRPYLISQSEDGSNCNVDVACGPNGELHRPFVDFASAACDCHDPEEIPDVSRRGPFCRKRMRDEYPPCHPHPSTQQGSCDCPPHKVDSESPEARLLFHTDYLAQFWRKRTCLERPCTFDAVSGRPLRHTQHIHGVGCVCDPRHGNVGVTLETQKYLKDAAGYNACGNVFAQGETDHPVEVELYAYFYIDDQLPVCFVRFPRVSEPAVPNAAPGSSLIVAEQWPHAYSQHVLDTDPSVKIHTRNCVTSLLMGTYRCNEIVWKEGPVSDCSAIADVDVGFPNHRPRFYNVFYNYPVCRYTEVTREEDRIYENKVIVNPLIIATTTPGLGIQQSNGYALKWKDGGWKVGLAEADASYFRTRAHDTPVITPHPNLESYIVWKWPAGIGEKSSA